MLVILVFLAIVIPLSLKRRGNRNKHLVQRSTYKIFSDYGGIDKALRFLQYLNLWVMGYLEEESIYVPNHSGLFLVTRANQMGRWATYMSRTRKAVRFIRAPMHFLSLKNRNINLSFANKLQTLTTLEALSTLISDLADMAFYITDHYSSLYIIGILDNKALNQTMDNFGNYCWITWAAFIAVSAVFKTLKLRHMGEKLDWKKSKVPYLILGDFLCACIEVFVGITFVNPTLAPKKVFATLVMISCTYKMTKIAIN